MENRTLKSQIRNLMQAFSVKGGTCYTINISKNIVPGYLYRVVDGVEHNISKEIGLPENANLDEMIAYYGARLPEEERKDYFAFFNVEHMLSCFARGETHLKREYWTNYYGHHPILVQRHILMYEDEETGDVLAISCALDMTGEHDAAEYRRRMEREQKVLEQNLSAARQANREQIEQIKTMADELIESADKLNRERYQNELLLEQIYYSIFKIDLEADTYEELYCKDGVEHLMRQKGTASAELRELCERFVVPNHQTEMIRFFDLSTVATRLCDDNVITTECKTMDGNWHQASFIVKHRDEQGKVSHLLYVTREISEEKRREERLISLAEDAQEASLAKTDFISRVAHDIRTPMNSIFGFLEIAEANLEDKEKIRYCLEKIHVAGEFLKALVNDVLDISSIENGRMQLTPTEMSLSQMMNEFSSTMSSASREKQQELRFMMGALPHDCIMADPLRLKQIYTNVLNNAIKYTPVGGKIEFSLREEEYGDTVRIIAEVRDTGIGMEKAFMEKMFTKFERASDNRIKSINGYGLGLAIVKQLVDLMQGTIEVTSALGEGSTFTITLDMPYVRERETQKREVARAVDCTGLHLLVAEDNELNREVMTELLALHGITCECAENGAVCLDCIKAATEGRYDAILMDMQMPVMNGLESTRAIRALPFPWAKTIPIIAMTANALKDDIRKCLDAGMNRHLAKPVEMNSLLMALSEITAVHLPKK